MIEHYRKIKNTVCYIFRTGMALSLLFLVVLAVVQVLTRYFVDVTIIWIEELSIYVMSWMAAIGVAWIWLENCSHIKMDILEHILPNRIVRYMDLGIDAVVSVLGFATMRIGIKAYQVNHGYIMSVINLDEGDRYLPVIVGGVLLMLCAAYMIVEHVYVLTKKGRAEKLAAEAQCDIDNIKPKALTDESGDGVSTEKEKGE